MTDLRTAAQMALDALMRLEQDTFHPAKVFLYKPAIEALRAALAQGEPKQQWRSLTSAQTKVLWNLTKKPTEYAAMIDAKLRELNG